MDLLLYIALHFVGLLLINLFIYGSAYWLVRKFFKSGRRNYFLIAWPLVLVSANFYALVGVPIEQRQKYNLFEEGTVYKKKEGVESIYMYGVGHCNDLCAELLLEEHIKKLLAVDSQNYHKLYQRSSNPNCLIDNLIQDYSSNDGLEFYAQRCIQTTIIRGHEFTELEGSSDESIVSMELNDTSVIPSELKPLYAFSRFKFATRIIDVRENLYTSYDLNVNGDNKVLAMQGKLIPERPVIPLIISDYPSRRVWDRDYAIDYLLTWSKYYGTDLSPRANISKQIELQGSSEIERKLLIQKTLDIALDGTITSNRHLPDISVSTLVIKRIFDMAENGDHFHTPQPIYQFLKLYDGYPFADTLAKYKDHQFDWVSNQVNNYLDEAWCVTNSDICDLTNRNL